MMSGGKNPQAGLSARDRTADMRTHISQTVLAMSRPAFVPPLFGKGPFTMRGESERNRLRKCPYRACTSLRPAPPLAFA
jgi:hypothetical protein